MSGNEPKKSELVGKHRVYANVPKTGKKRRVQKTRETHHTRIILPEPKTISLWKRKEECCCAIFMIFLLWFMFFGSIWMIKTIIEIY